MLFLAQRWLDQIGSGADPRFQLPRRLHVANLSSTVSSA
jgi:hypothetical protein